MTVLAEPRSTTAARAPEAERFLDAYDELAPMVFRLVRRLGVPDEALDDVVQEIFVVVHRRGAEFEGRSTLKTWTTGITLRVVQAFLRKARRQRARVDSVEDFDTFADSSRAPDAALAREQALGFVRAFLQDLDEDKRTAFVLAELEQLTAPEIAELTGANLNTVYARIRAARRLFSEAVALRRAAEGEVSR